MHVGMGDALTDKEGACAKESIQCSEGTVLVLVKDLLNLERSISDSSIMIVATVAHRLAIREDVAKHVI